MKNFRKGPQSAANIVEWLRDMRGNPYNPASNFDVGAVFRVSAGGQDDYYFAGVNVENPDHRLSTHAEEAAIAAMVTALGRQASIVEGWVMGAPRHLTQGSPDPLANNKVTCCGKCRQQIAGFAGPDAVIHSVSLNGATSKITVGAFLPDTFSFRDFIPEATDIAASSRQTTPPTQDEAQNRLIRQGKTLSEPDILNWLKSLESVDYATKTGQAAIVELANGAYVAGTKVEEAAFVSINPIQSAMAVATSAFGVQKVVKVWALATGRDGQELPRDAFQPLSLSAIQTLAQFAQGPQTPICLFNGSGQTDTLFLKDTSAHAPTFAQPFYKKPPTPKM